MAAHSLNLVGQFAAGYCQLAVGFFDLLRRLYLYFDASTYHWKLLSDQLVSKGLPTRAANGSLTHGSMGQMGHFFRMGQWVMGHDP